MNSIREWIGETQRMRLAADNFALSSQGRGQEDFGGDFEEAHYELHGTAVHEAGHAVAATLLNIPFKHVSIEPDGNARTGGKLALSNPSNNWISRGTQFALGGCIVLMSGSAAALRYAGEKADLLETARNDRNDLEFLSMLLAVMLHPSKGHWTASMPEAVVIRTWAWREACLMMANSRAWRAVTELVNALIRDETVSRRHVLEIVDGAGVKWRPKFIAIQPATSSHVVLVQEDR